jgi:hypothetical protein
VASDEKPPARSLALRRSGALALLLGLFFAYLLSTSRERPWSDATPIWQVAENLVLHGEVSISTAWPPAQPRGRDGKIYATAPLIQSLVHVPGVLLHQAIIAVAPMAAGLYWPLTSHLAPAALGALACVLFFLICRRLALGWTAAALGALALALGTTVWVYARSPYSEILQAACFIGLFGQLLETTHRPGYRSGVALGVWAGLLINAKLVYVVSLPGALVFLVWHLRRDWRTVGRVVGGAAAGMIPLIALILVYNHLRWGSALETGYGPRESAPTERLLLGLWGQLFSPGKSIFLYSPPLLLSLAGLRATHRRCPEVLWLVLATVVPVLLLTAKLQFWAGDYAWGTRYMVFAVPVLLLPAAVLIDDLVQARRSRTGALGAPATSLATDEARPSPVATRDWRWKARVAVVAAVVAGGVFVQVMGNAFFWDHYIRIQREARNRWLGEPNTRGTPFPDFGGVCGACFEDMHGMQWLPPFQPIEGHWWLLRHAPFHHDWITAEADAPWHRYTSLRLNIASTYAAARLDWWYMDFAVPANRIPGLLLLTLLSFATLASGALFLRRKPSVNPPGGQPEGLAAAT